MSDRIANSAQRRGHWRAPDTIAPVVLGVVFLAIYGLIEWRFRSLGTFTVNDILFDADPRTRMRGIAHGWERLLLIHPLFPYAFTIPIRVIAKAWTMVAGSGPGGEAALRELLAMAVAPACAAIAVALMARTLLTMGVKLTGAVLCAIGFGASFSLLVFGSIPEHYGVSNLLACMALLLCATVAAGRSSRLLDALWWPLGIAATGVTITNVMIPACCYFTNRYDATKNIRTSVLATTKYTAGVGVVTLILALVAAAASGEIDRWLPRAMGGSGSEAMLLGYLATPVERVARMPKAAADAIVPGTLTLASSGSSDRTEMPVPRISLETGATFLGTPLVVMLLLVAGIAGHHQADRRLGPPVAAALAILAGNIALHSVFGKEHFVYSPHWIACLWLVLAGVWRSRYWREPYGSAVAVVAIALVAYLNYGTLHEIFDVTARAGLSAAVP